jgi:hypothetical protein
MRSWLNEAVAVYQSPSRVFEETCERPQVNGDADVADAEKVGEDVHVIV